MHHLSGAPPWRRLTALAIAALMVLGASGCAKAGPAEDAKQPASKGEVILASTTSTEDSGLFDVLVPAFEKASGYDVKIIAVGTGEALKLGESKDADVLLVHAKKDEEKLVAAGYGVERRDVMYNDFLIVGPAADPAGVKGSTDTTAAFTAIADAGKAGKAVWVSRGDDSGTHKKELKSWGGLDATPTPAADPWYEETGQGMGETLKIASEKGAYTLADRATYLAQRDALDLAVIFEKDKGLLNQYGVIVVTDARNQEGGQAFFDWILSAEGQQVIRDFGVEKYGEPLFIPNAE